jgi:hypothetical protein
MPGWIDVRDFGAIGNGSVNDQPAIQAAITKAATSGTVFFPPGIYRLDGDGNVPEKGLVALYDDQTWIMHGAELNLNFIGPGITIGGIAGPGTGTTRVKINGPTISRAGGAPVAWEAGSVGIRLLKCNTCSIYDPFIRWLEKGIEITTLDQHFETTQNFIYNPRIASCGWPFFIYAGAGSTVNENMVFGGDVGYGGVDPITVHPVTHEVEQAAITIDHHESSAGNVNGIKFIGTYVGCSIPATATRPKAIRLNGVGCQFMNMHIEGFPQPMVEFGEDARVGGAHYSGLPNYFWGGSADFISPEVNLGSHDSTGANAPFLFTGQAGSAIAGGTPDASHYVWMVKQLGGADKTTLAVRDSADRDVWKCTGQGTVVQTGALTVGGGVVSTSPAAGMGYATGAGGTVTQATSKSTRVTLNRITGRITMNAASLAANTAVSFTLANSAIAAGDVLILNHTSGGTAGAYALNAQGANGSAAISVRNLTVGALGEAIIIGFAVIKAVTS